MSDAREYLESIKATKTCIQMKLDRVMSLRESLTSMSVPMDQENVTKTKNTSIMSQTIALIQDMESEIDQQARELYLIEQRAYQLLDQIQPENARILTDYYLKNLSTVELAKKMFVTRRHAQRKLRAALSEFQAVLDTG